jgi:transposase InsO family protein
VVNRHLGIGWEYVHVCIDDASRIAFVQVMADQRKESAVAFLEAAIAYYAKLGVRVERIMTDNGSCYRSKTFRTACKQRKFSPCPTHPKPMARPNASSKPRYANGHTRAPIITPLSDRLN